MAQVQNPHILIPESKTILTKEELVEFFEKEKIEFYERTNNSIGIKGELIYVSLGNANWFLLKQNSIEIGYLEYKESKSLLIDLRSSKVKEIHLPKDINVFFSYQHLVIQF